MIEQKEFTEEESYGYFTFYMVDELSKSKKEAFSRILFNALYKSYHLVKKQVGDSIQILYYDVNVGYYVDAYSPFTQLIRDAHDMADKGYLTESKMLACYKSVFFSRRSLNALDSYNPPPKYYLPLQDAVIDVRTGEVVPPEECEQYHFTFVRPFRFHIEENPLYIEIFKRIMKDWSDNQEDVESVLTQYLRACAEGDNKQKAMLIEGPGGNGKSSYMTVATLLAGESFTSQLMVHQFDNDYNLDVIKDHTTLIIGDENKTNPRFRGESLAKIKSLIMNQPLTINPKYKSPRIISNNLCCIQSSNTPFLFSEVTNAMKARFIYIKWTKKDYREMKEQQPFEFDLDKLLANPAFIENIFHYLITQTPSRKTLIVPDSIKNNLTEQLEVSDNVTSFVKELDERGILRHNSILPTPFLYQAYLHWLKEENPSSKPMSKKMFTDRLKQALHSYGFQLDRLEKGGTKKTRLSAIPFSKWNRYQCDGLVEFDLVHGISSKKEYKLFTYFYNPSQELELMSYNDFIEWIQEHTDSTKWTFSESRQVISFIIDHEHRELMSTYGLELETLY